MGTKLYKYIIKLRQLARPKYHRNPSVTAYNDRKLVAVDLYESEFKYKQEYEVKSNYKSKRK
jgi:hypothetical protein